MGTGNLLYAQSGGVTAVINATAGAVIEAARARSARIGKVYAARDGILGALREDLVDTSAESTAAIRALAHTPGGAFGSCRFKLKDIDRDRASYERLIAVFKAHDIRWFLYNGGNDSADTALKLSSIGAALGYPVTCIGVPKTVDNDLVETDCCPGFGSVAKYTAVSVMEAGFDVRAMRSTSTRVFVLETMGRHAGWIAASAGLAARDKDDPPHLILLPEVVFDETRFLAAVDACVKRIGYCVVVVSEGVRDASGRFLAEAGSVDAFGHKQLGGVGPLIADLVGAKLGLKHHAAVSDYLQRSARHIASKTDLEQARAVGKAAVSYALAGMNAVMPVIRRTSSRPYRWTVEPAPLERIANREKKLPASYIRSDGFGITAAARRYLAPLIEGQAYPPFRADGLPEYVTLRNRPVRKKLPPFEVGGH
jgi:6-phosphofructokinase 1